MFRNLLFGLLVLAFAAEASAQTTPPGPPPMRHTTQQTIHHTTTKPGHTTVRKTSTNKVGMATPAKRTGAVVTRRKTTAAAPDPASGKGQGVYAAPGEPVDIQNAATTGYDGAARRAKTKTTTTLSPPR